MFCAWCGSEVTTVSYAPCPRCGRPTNGAQTAPPSAGGGGNTAMTIVAIIIGVFVVIGVIGILAAIAIPNLLTAMQRSKQKRTMADMRSLATAVEAYGADNNGYPNVTSYDELRPLLTPKFIKVLPSMDGWGHPFRYSCVEEQEGRCSKYVVGSGGKDGNFAHDSAKEYVDAPIGGTSSFDCDLIFSNGQFTDYPEGAQH
jgi:type II secretory pathway pseudopilin PulG